MNNDQKFAYDTNYEFSTWLQSIPAIGEIMLKIQKQACDQIYRPLSDNEHRADCDAIDDVYNGLPARKPPVRAV